MRAILVDEAREGRPLVLGELPSPPMGPADVRIRVRATAVNRADLLQRQGLYPPPPGASPVLGLECAGEIVEVGPAAAGFRPGDRVMALLAGGGYAEEAVVDHGSVLPVPPGMSDEAAAAFPEAFLTAFSNLFLPGLGALAPGERALVHGGGGGVGTAAIRLCAEAGNPCYVTAGSPEKLARCRALGATEAIDYRHEDFAARYLEKNLAALAVGGRLVEIGLMGGAQAEVNLGQLLVRRLAIIGSTLRSRSSAEKAAIVAAFRARFGEALAAGRLAPVIDRVLPLSEAAEAHRLMKESAHFGKIVLRVA